MSTDAEGQRCLMERGFKTIAERNETFLHILPSLTRAELTALIAKRPKVWAPFAKFLSELP